MATFTLANRSLNVLMFVYPLNNEKLPLCRINFNHASYMTIVHVCMLSNASKRPFGHGLNCSIQHVHFE